MLRVESLTAGYGSAIVLRDLSFDMADGEALCILGQSGAGKTTLMSTIFQIERPIGGTMTFQGVRLNGVPTWKLGALGLALVPEGRRLFPDHTILENLRLGAQRLIRKEGERAFDAELARVAELFPFMKERMRERGAHLSGGEQQMVALARALVSKPRLLCLDEPTSGLAPIAVNTVTTAIRALRETGLSVLMTEQRSGFAAEAGSRTVVLSGGAIRASDGSESVAWRSH